jgi:Xaa-Pro aminopeptidase
VKYESLPSALFIKNRHKFTAQMQQGSLAVFNSNDIFSTGADSSLPFHQHRNIFYLSGIDQEESILLLFPDAKDPKFREILFLKETNEHIAIWEGAKLSKSQATAVSGISSVYWLEEFNTVFGQLMSVAKSIYFNENNHYRKNAEMQSREDRFIIQTKLHYTKHNYLNSFPIINALRGIKEKEEIELIARACNITEKGFRRLLNFVKPGVMEYEIEAELIHEFLRNRSKGFAYTPIVASGYSACVLHYIENNQMCKSGDMLLLDVAAEYANYSSDMTRTIPVNGVFTPRQKAVYESVLRVKKEASKLLTPGIFLKDYHSEVGKMMTSELLDLGLIDKADIQNEDPKWPAYKKFFMHGTSHHLGLDTHDFGAQDTPIQANMVFTVEPGIYIPSENLGIRLEDNVVVQKEGAPKNLMANIPIEVEEIELLMQQSGA